ncbi:hypothetical protein DMN91_003944 [Ooceraea biroi]|uniref:Reverse transcriptase domain-containing protein n=1 Tax=Ooceraea biroi TaxID=2015173 RepID=A0A3L8DVG1_OOCBI|nr:hypothetical protein DMN91_003944 [Ooceraea biroi]
MQHSNQKFLNGHLTGMVVRYADDLQLYLHCDPATLGDGIARVNEDIEALCCWASDNMLRSNPGKTKAMILGSARNLGIYIAPTLSWRETVTATCNKIYRTLYQLGTNSGCLPLCLRKTLINSLIYPQLDCCSVVMSDITGMENTRLQRALNACVRFVFGVRRDEHITPYFGRAGWLKVHERRDYFIGVLMYKALRYRVPLHLSERLRYVTDARDNVATRVCGLDLVVPSCRTATYQSSFIVYGTRLWNSLPASLRSSASVPVFKRALYDHLLELSVH